MHFRPSRTLKSTLHHRLSNAFVVTGLLAALMVSPAFADEAADVTKLMRAGQYAEAIAKADAFLGKTPRDAQMRFLKGVILSEQGKTPEAIAVFTKLTDDFPKLPEPYNNLAVLYASSGQFDKARAALEMAIHTNPSYATAYENLGDVHARLASQAYDKAFQLDSTNTAAKSKLASVRSLVGNSTVGMNPKTAVASAPVVAKPAAVAAAPVVVAKVEPQKPEPKPVGASSDADQQEVLSAVTNWAKAWSARDVNAYLHFYGSDFQTPKGESRKVWADERTARIAGKGSISVDILSPQVSIAGDTATVKFRQVYVSDRLKSDSQKTLILTRQSGKWLIKQERSGS